MGRSHAWLPRGAVLVEPRPMNWGTNLTLVGAIRIDRWLTLATAWGALNKARFVAWVRRHLVRHLRRDDVVVMDNLPAHKARAGARPDRGRRGHAAVSAAVLARFQPD